MPINYGQYFRRAKDMEKIQQKASEISWIERYETPEESHEIVLMLGCNILRLPHIAREVVRVFEHLELDFVAVGGSQFCCGIPWHKSQDAQTDQKVMQHTVRRIESYRPQKVIMWCQNCNVHFTNGVGRDGQMSSFDVTTNAVEFLADRAQTGEGLPWTGKMNKKVVIHAHAGLDGDLVGQRRAQLDREATTALLSHIPGVEVLDVVISDPALQHECGIALMSLEREVFERDQRRTIDRALELGADEIITIPSGCQRVWCGETTERLRFRNYISVVSEGLGLPLETDFLTQYKVTDSVEEIVAMSRPMWASHGMTEREATELVTHYKGTGELRPDAV